MNLSCLQSKSCCVDCDGLESPHDEVLKYFESQDGQVSSATDALQEYRNFSRMKQSKYSNTSLQHQSAFLKDESAHIVKHYRMKQHRYNLDDRDIHEEIDISRGVPDLNFIGDEQQEEIYMNYVHENDFLSAYVPPIYEPEPSAAEIRKIISEVTKENLPKIESDGKYRAPRRSTNNFKVFGFGWYTCSRGHRLHCENAVCCINLLTSEISKRICVSCLYPDCQIAEVNPKFPAHTIKEMTEKACSLFLALNRDKPRYTQEPSTEKIKIAILNAMFEKNVCPSQIDREHKFSLEILTESFRYFEVYGPAQYYCSCNHRWEDVSWCILDMFKLAICYRYKRRCTRCKQFVEPTFSSLTRITFMAEQAIDEFLERTGKLQRSDHVSIYSSMWLKISPFEPEPPLSEVREMFNAAMAENKISEFYFFDNLEDFDLSMGTRYSSRYYCRKEFAWFQCPNGHRWYDTQAFCYMDLDMKGICYKYERKCRCCKELVKPTYSSEAIKRMINSIIKQYLFRTGRRRMRKTVVSKKSLMIRQIKKYCSAWPVKVVHKSTKLQSRKKPCESEPSERNIKNIVLQAMAREYVKPTISWKTHFDLSSVKPWSLRYYRTSGSSSLSCGICKTSMTSCMICYVDIWTQTICHRSRKVCGRCSSLMKTQFSPNVIQKMAQYCIKQFFIRSGRALPSQRE